MPDPPPRPDLRGVEPEVRRLWASRRLPPRTGVLGPDDGPRVRLLEGWFEADDPAELTVPRAVAADIDARHLMLTGRGAAGTLRWHRSAGGPDTPEIAPLLDALGVWVGGAERPWDATAITAGVQAITARLAERGIVVARDGPLRFCLACRAPRTPERIVYQKEVGDTFLVRFPIAGSEPSIDALVWVDAPWRLLGASALLVHPDVPYSVADYHLRGATARILASHGSLARLTAWLPDATVEVREEKLGKEWVGRPYAYPLRHEFPIGGALDPPAGTIQATTEVGDTGTGIVPLVPGHGPTDAEIADRLGIAGWPLLTSRGVLDPTLMHKYSGLDVETANEFVARDLTESGAVLARLRVVRGVPYCAICGHRIVWSPGRAWCLEPTRLPPDQQERYARLLPHERPIGQLEVSRWPVSETTSSTDPEAVTLLECARCERLDAPDGATQCPCGGTRRRVARRLLPSVDSSFAQWARQGAIPPSDRIHLYIADRRRAPTLIHHLAAWSGAEAGTAEVGLTVLPTLSRVAIGEAVARFGADPVRAAIARTGPSHGSTDSFAERCRQESERLVRLLDRARTIAAQCPPELLREGVAPPDLNSREFEIEDRAILARWARAHLKVLAAFDRSQPGTSLRVLDRFVDRDLPRYLQLVRPRLALAGQPPTKRGVLRALRYLLRSAATALSPVAPFSAEAIHRSLIADPRSVFETTDFAVDRTLLDEALEAAWDRWQGIVAAADELRAARNLPAATVVPAAAVVLADEAAAARLRADRGTIERIARIGRLEVASPEVPWEGRHRRMVPVESEIQRAYPALASQIVHLLNRMPPRRSAELGARETTVFVHGIARSITPEMLAAVDTLPDGFVPVPYPGGELYLQLPAPATTATTPPPLSPDAFWLTRRVRARVGTVGLDAPRRVAIVTAVDPLAQELREKAGPIAQYLGLSELRVTGATPGARPHHRIDGRTRTGARWSVALSGPSGPARPRKQRAARADGRRVPRPTEAGASSETDFADAAVIAREESIRGLGHQFDELIAAPLLGPSKLTLAWEAGFHSLDDFRDAPFDRVATLTGFGRPVAEALWSKMGRPVPTAPPRARPTVRRTAPARPTGSVAATVLAPPAPSLVARERPAPSPEAASPPTPEERKVETPELPPTALAVEDEPTPVAAIPLGPPAELPIDPAESPAPPPAEPLVTPPPRQEPGPAPPSGETLTTPVPEEPAVTPADALAIPDELGSEAEAAISAEPAAPPPSEVAVEEIGSAEPAIEAPPEPTLLEGVPATSEEPSPTGDPLAPTEIVPPTDVPPIPDAAPEPSPTPPEPIERSAETAPPAEVRAELPVGAPEPAILDENPPPPDGPGPGDAPPSGPASESAPAAPTAELANGELAPSVALEVGAEDATTPSVTPTVEPPPPVPEVAPVPSPPIAAEAPSEIGPPSSELPPPTDLPAPTEPAAAESAMPTPAPVAALVPEPTPDPTETPVGELRPTITPVPEHTEAAIAQELLGPAAAEVPASSGEAPPAEPPAAEPSPEPVAPATPEPAPAAVPPVAEAPVIEPPAEAAPAPPTPELVPNVPEVAPLAEAPAPSVPSSPALSEPAPAVAPEPIPPVEIPPPTGIEVDYAPALFFALQPFLDATAAGHRGIAIVRELPERIRVHVGPRPVDVYWLTNLDRPRTLRPTDLPALTSRLVRALDEEGVTAIFLEGIEYLARVHGIDRASEFLSTLDRAARARLARVWLHVTPGLLPEAELDRLLAAIRPEGEPTESAPGPAAGLP